MTGNLQKDKALSENIRSQIEFSYVAYDLYSGIQQYIQTKVQSLTEVLGRPSLSSSLYTIIYELATNGLKALYKHAFYEHVIYELGWSDIPYESWLKIFRTEIATNKAENFAHVCRQHNLSIQVSTKIVQNNLRLEVTNNGNASSIEVERLRSLYKRSLGGASFENILDAELVDINREEDGMGIPLIIFTLKGLSIPLENFKFIVTKSKTTARIDFPLSLFHGHQDKAIVYFQQKPEILDILWGIYSALDYSTVIFTTDGRISKISGALLKQLGIEEDNISALPGLLKASFYEDIFMGPFNIKNTKKFENYRLGIQNILTDKNYVYNISGKLHTGGQVVSLWQQVNIDLKGEKLSEGSMLESIQVQKLIAPYIPPMILIKARETIHKGLKSLPNEGKDVTILFADLIGFTSRSQSMAHNVLLDLLNLVMGIVVHSIEKNSGYIDKFIGDGVMCIFMEPLSAITAAIEIQNNLFQLNEFRTAGGADAVNLRIGINSGQVILGSIGTKKRMDWTALGDVVNTASRIEKLGRKNAVLVSLSTYLRTKDLIEVQEKIDVHIRGKVEEVASLYFIKSVSVLKGEQKITVSLYDDNESDTIQV
jgi:class 3 adenylate cyclase